MNSVFIDANIPMYAAGKDHPLKMPAQSVLQAAVEERIDAFTDAEVLQEIWHRYWHIREHARGRAIFQHFHRIMLGKIIAIDAEDVRFAHELGQQFVAVPPRDLIHLAVMLRRDIPAIITADKHFDRLPGIRRIDPLTFEL